MWARKTIAPSEPVGGVWRSENNGADADRGSDRQRAV
jgi:hypothetical protein